MERSFWLSKWESNQIGFHEGQPNSYLVRHWPRLGVPAHGRVLVPLCGKSVDMTWLAEKGHQVLGVELIPQAVKAYFEERGLEPAMTETGTLTSYSADAVEILCGDFFALGSEPLEGVDAVYDRAALIALSPPQRREYAGLLKRSLPASVKMLLVTLEYPSEAAIGPPFPVMEDEVRELYGDRFRIQRLERADVPAGSPRLRERGITVLTETVYQLTSNEASAAL